MRNLKKNPENLEAKKTGIQKLQKIQNPQNNQKS